MTDYIHTLVFLREVITGRKKLVLRTQVPKIDVPKFGEVSIFVFIHDILWYLALNPKIGGRGKDKFAEIIFVIL